MLFLLRSSRQSRSRSRKRIFHVSSSIRGEGYGGGDHQHQSLISKYCFSTQTAQQQPYPTTTRKTVRVYNALDLGCMDYSKSWAWQHVLLNRRLHQRRLMKEEGIIQKEQSSSSAAAVDNNNDFDSVLLLEHNPVYTLGRGADENHLTFVSEAANNNSTTTTLLLQQEVQTKLSRKVRGPGTARLAVDRSIDDGSSSKNQLVSNNLSVQDAVTKICDMSSPVIAPNGVPIYRVERGGEVTFHGPSQLVVYPLFDLQSPEYKKDLHWYLRMVEEVVIQTLKHYNIESNRDEDNTGVWVGDEKVAAVGISSSRWITTHGFALNIDPDLNYFDTSMILPCGIEGKGVTSIAKILKDRFDDNDTNDNIIPTIQQVANVVIQTMEDVFDISLILDNNNEEG